MGRLNRRSPILLFAFRLYPITRLKTLAFDVEELRALEEPTLPLYHRSNIIEEYLQLREPSFSSAQMPLHNCPSYNGPKLGRASTRTLTQRLLYRVRVIRRVHYYCTLQGVCARETNNAGILLEDEYLSNHEGRVCRWRRPKSDLPWRARQRAQRRRIQS